MIYIRPQERNELVNTISKHKRLPTDVLKECITKRLEESVRNYYKRLDYSLYRLEDKNELKVLRKFK